MTTNKESMYNLHTQISDYKSALWHAHNQGLPHSVEDYYIDRIAELRKQLTC